MALIHTLVFPLVIFLAGSAGPGWLGVRLAEADRPTIGEVVPNSPAAKAGMKIGDVFQSINGKRIGGVESLVASFGKLEAGERAKFVMLRRGKALEFAVRLAEKPVEGREPVRVEKTPKKVGKRDTRPGFLGIEIEETDSGIVVTNLVAGGPGGRSGVRRGDTIRTFNGKRVRSIDDLDEIMKDIRARDRVRMGLARRNQQVDIAFQAAPRPGAKPLVEAKDRAKGHDHDRDGKSDHPAKAGEKHAAEKRAAEKHATEKRNAETKRRAEKQRAAKQRAAKRKAEAKKAEQAAKKKAEKKVTKAAAKGGPGVRAPKGGGKVLSYSDSLEKSLAAARRSGRPVLVVFGASWCVNCETLKRSLRHSSLQDMLGRYERVWIDTDQQSALADKYKVESLPHTVFLSSQGKQREKIVGYQPPKILAPLLRQGLGGTAAKKTAAKKAVAKKTAAKKATASDSAAKRAAAKRAAAKKANAKKAAAKRAATKKAAAAKKAAARPARRDAPAKDSARAAGTPIKRLPRATAARNREAVMANELRQLRSEVSRLRSEQRQQRVLLNRILRELQKKK